MNSDTEFELNITENEVFTFICVNEHFLKDSTVFFTKTLLLHLSPRIIKQCKNIGSETLKESNYRTDEAQGLNVRICFLNKKRIDIG